MNQYYYGTPVGVITIKDNGHAITGLDIENLEHMGSIDKKELQNHKTVLGTYPDADFVANLNQKAANVESNIAKEAARQLFEYFEKKRTVFDLPVEPNGTAFQKKVWSALRAIPYGETRCYKDIADVIGSPKACRAVGGANNKNAIIILIPCHRVIGKDGSLVGFGCGLDVKSYLLALEAE